MILLLTVFLRLLNSFDSILRQETSTTLQQDKCLSVYLLVMEIFFATADNQAFSVFVSKVQNERGILFFI